MESYLSIGCHGYGYTTSYHLLTMSYLLVFDVAADFVPARLPISGIQFAELLGVIFYRVIFMPASRNVRTGERT